MPYVITNNYTNLKLTITSKQSNISLKTYINDSDTVFKTYTPTVTSITGGYSLEYNIATKDYTIDDIITKFELVSNTSTHLWQTNEGVIWLIDGEESEPSYTNTKTCNFTDAKAHTVEAVYVGNDGLEYSTTGRYSVLVEQPLIDDEGGLANTGVYRIKFLNKNSINLTYNDGQKLWFQLTKGGKPVVTNPQRNIEIIKATGEPESTTLDNNGKAYITNNHNWDVGTYLFGAYYLDEELRTITRDTKKLSIGKGTPKILDNSQTEGSFIPNSQYKATLRFNNEPLANVKLSVYTNGKMETLTTNKYGSVFHKFTKTGTYKMKVVYKGDKNLKKVEKESTIVVVKANG